MLVALKKFDAADSLVAELLRKDKRNTGGLRLRATIRIERGQLEPAITDLRQAINDEPRSTALMLLLANAYERSGSMELAEKQYADATRASNFDPSVTLSHVAFLRRRGNDAQAEDILTEMAGRFPQNIQVLSNLAEVRLARETQRHHTPGR